MPRGRATPWLHSCLGFPSSTSTTLFLPTYAFLHNYGFFVEDTYQATPALTVTAGLRWEQPGSFSEEHNIGAVFVPNAPLTVGNVSSYTNPVGATVQLKGVGALLDSPLILHEEKSRFIGRHSPRVWGWPIALILTALCVSATVSRSSRQFSIRTAPS